MIKKNFLITFGRSFMKKLITFSMFYFFVLGCGAEDKVTSSIDGLGFSENGNNLALLFGSPQNLPGVKTDIRELNKVILDPQFNFHFRTVTDDRANKKSILADTAREVKNVDSLIWYYSGHGAGGALDTGTGFLSFSEVASVIKKARNNAPLKRLLVFVDACESGHIVNGDVPIITEKRWIQETFFEPLQQERDGKLYKQAFVMASSQKDENSADLGEDYGGAFTYSLRMTLAKIRKDNPRATLKEFADMTIKKTIEESRRDGERSHTPLYKGFPVADVVNDLLFIYNN